LVFEGIADGSLRPGAGRPLSLVAEAGAIVLAEVGKRAVDELAARIDRSLRIRLQVVVLKAAERMLPGSGAADSELGAGQKIVLVSELVGIGRQDRIAVEPPVRLHPRPVVRMTQPQSKGDTGRKSYADVAAPESVRIAVVDALAFGIELVEEKVVVENLIGARHRCVSIGGGECPAIRAEFEDRLRCR